MLDDYKDVTRSFDAPWYIDIDPYTSVKKVLEGTFCFPFGKGFGCGEQSEASTAKELSLKASLSATVSGITGGLEIGTKHTQSDKWSYTSKKCEYCRPRICFPDSRLVVYERRVQVMLVPLPMTSLITEFESGPQGEIRRNCTQNDPNCEDCKDTSETAYSSETGKAETNPAAHCAVITPTSWGLDQMTLPQTGSAGLADTYAGLLSSTYRLLASRGPGRPALGVRHPDGAVTWLTGANDGPDMALLSLDARDFLPGQDPAALTGRYCAAVVALPCGLDVVASAHLLIASPDGKSQRLDADVATASGVAMVMSAVFDLGMDGLAQGTRAALQIDLTDPERGCPIGGITKQFIVPKSAPIAP